MKKKILSTLQFINKAGRLIYKSTEMYCKPCNPHSFHFFFNESRRLVSLNLSLVEPNAADKFSCNKVTADQIKFKHPMVDYN